MLTQKRVSHEFIGIQNFGKEADAQEVERLPLTVQTVTKGEASLIKVGGSRPWLTYYLQGINNPSQIPYKV